MADDEQGGEGTRPDASGASASGRAAGGSVAAPAGATTAPQERLATPSGRQQREAGAKADARKSFVNPLHGLAVDAGTFRQPGAAAEREETANPLWALATDGGAEPSGKPGPRQSVLFQENPLLSGAGGAFGAGAAAARFKRGLRAGTQQDNPLWGRAGGRSGDGSNADAANPAYGLGGAGARTGTIAEAYNPLMGLMMSDNPLAAGEDRANPLFGAGTSGRDAGGSLAMQSNPLTGGAAPGGRGSRARDNANPMFGDALGGRSAAASRASTVNPMLAQGAAGGAGGRGGRESLNPMFQAGEAGQPAPGGRQSVVNPLLARSPTGSRAAAGSVANAMFGAAAGWDAAGSLLMTDNPVISLHQQVERSQALSAAGPNPLFGGSGSPGPRGTLDGTLNPLALFQRPASGSQAEANPVFQMLNRDRTGSGGSSTQSSARKPRRYRKWCIWFWLLAVVAGVCFVLFGRQSQSFVPEVYSRDGDPDSFSRSLFPLAKTNTQAVLKRSGSQVSTWDTAALNGVALSVSFQGVDLDKLSATEVDELKDEFAGSLAASLNVPKDEIFILNVLQGSVVVKSFLICASDCGSEIAKLSGPTDLFDSPL